MALIEAVNFGPVQGIRVGRFNLGINTTFIVYTYKDVMIDCGPSNQWPFVKEFATASNTKQVLLTHHHEDHSGNASALHHQLGLPIHTNQLCQQLVSNGFPVPKLRKMIWGKGNKVEAKLIPDKFKSDAGVELDVMLTPGHTDDMSVFYDNQNGWLFTGDLYIASQVRYLHKEEDLAHQLASLNKVLELDFDTAFCPHRGIMKQGKRDIQKKRDFILELVDSVIELAQQGLSNKEIQRRLLGREDMLSIVSSFDFSKKELIKACLALGETTHK
ncbi:MBL fold metallo-hydrolase [Flocculibacter collagenilyticus]|uniref:MBL fold metallo-hydrolase n=1 Tax=Flocculibacter collagenilyticus TaxID=2744479 RepID=UPI0018F2D41E|nr:MBL fold metallo-hydrolase [Flocculibacter collagenilyticus]